MNEDVVPCPKCNAEMFVGAHFCMRCGMQLSGPMPRIELEFDEALTRSPDTVRYPPPPLPPPLPPLPPPRRPDSSPRIAAVRPMRILSDSTARLSVVAKPDATEKPPAAPLSPLADSATAPMALMAPSAPEPGLPEPGSGPRASTRPSAVPFMDLSAAETDGALSAPGNLSEALARASRLPDFSIDDIDDGFASIQDRETKSQATDSLADSYADMQSLFADMVAAHLAPVRELLSDLDAGQAHSESLGLCRPVARALQNAAEQLPDQQLHRALSELSAALSAMSSSGAAQIREPEHRTLRDAYAALARLLPSVSDHERDRASREPIIIQAIFECTAGLGRIQRDKLIAAGFTGLSMLCLARAEELSAASGVPLELAERLVAEVARFKRAAAQSALDASRANERHALSQLTLQLCQQNESFETSRRGWSRQDQESKRRAQREREETLAQVNIVLAQLGEFTLISELQKLPFDRKLSELERFLSPAASDGQRLSQASGGQ